MARGWDISGVSFDVYDAGGNDQHFANWTNNYTSQGPNPCAQACPPTVRVIGRIAKALDVDPVELFRAPAEKQQKK